MTVTDRDVSALAHLATRLRQDTHGCGPWDLHGTTIVFGQHLKGTHLATALELVLAHGQDPAAKTPAAVTRPFTPTELGTPVRPHCDKHPSQYADSCGQCEAEDRYAHAASDQTRDQALAAMRAQVAGAQHAAQAQEDQ